MVLIHLELTKIGVSVVQLEIWPMHHGEWHGQLRDTETGKRFGEEWIGQQRGAVIGIALKWLPLTHLSVVDVAPPN